MALCCLFRVTNAFERLRIGESERYQTGTEGINLRGGPEALDESGSTFVGRRQTAFDCRAEMSLSFDPINGDEAGLAVVANERYHYQLGGPVETVCGKPSSVFVLETRQKWSDAPRLGHRPTWLWWPTLTNSASAKMAKNLLRRLATSQRRWPLIHGCLPRSLRDWARNCLK